MTLIFQTRLFLKVLILKSQGKKYMILIDSLKLKFMIIIVIFN